MFKYKIIKIPGIILFSFFAFYAAEAASPIQVSASCNSVTFEFSGFSNSAYIKRIGKDGLVINTNWVLDGFPAVQLGTKLSKFTDLGNNVNLAFFPNLLIPNNTYSYIAQYMKKFRDDESGAPNFACYFSPCEVEENFDIKTTCPPNIELSENKLMGDVVPQVDTSQDSNLINLAVKSKTDNSVFLSIDIKALNLGKEKEIRTAEKIGYITQISPPDCPWWAPFCSRGNYEIKFTCTSAKGCEDVKGYGFDGFYGWRFYECPKGEGCNLDVYRFETKKITIPGENSYDILRNGIEIAGNISGDQKSFIDENLQPGTSYAYTTRTPSVHTSYEGLNLPPEVVNWDPNSFPLNGLYVVEKNKIIPEIKSIFSPSFQYKRSLIVRTSGLHKDIATIVLSIDIPSNAVGEYRIPGHKSINRSSGQACLKSAINVNDFCLWKWNPEKIVTVFTDKTYDVLRDGIEIAGNISIGQKNFIDTDLIPDTSYTYTIQIPSVHSRKGVVKVGSSGGVILLGASSVSLPSLAPPVGITITVVTAGMPPSSGSPPSGGTGGTGGSGEESPSLPNGFVPQKLREVKP